MKGEGGGGKGGVQIESPLQKKLSIKRQAFLGLNVFVAGLALSDETLKQNFNY